MKFQLLSSSEASKPYNLPLFFDTHSVQLKSNIGHFSHFRSRIQVYSYFDGRRCNINLVNPSECSDTWTLSFTSIEYIYVQ